MKTTGKTYKPRPMGYQVSAMRLSGANGASGTVWDCAKSLRQAMKWGQKYMARGHENFFSLTPIWGPVA